MVNKFITFSKHGREDANPLKDLTQRELEIAELFVKGLGNHEVAKE